MAYRIRRDEGLGSAFARILAEETAHAAGEAAADPTRRASAVHQLRKRCKRVRGLIALYRVSLGTHAASTDRRIRRCARSLAGARSAQALAATARRFDLPPPPIEQTGRTSLRPDDLLSVVHVLETVADECVPLTLNTSQAGIRRGLRRADRRSAKAWKQAVALPSTDNLHRWRTRAKAHWYAVRLTQDLFPDGARPRRNRLARIGRLLGRHHDLSAILKRLRVGGKPEADPDVRRIRKIRRRLTRKALKLASRVYAR